MRACGVNVSKASNKSEINTTYPLLWLLPCNPHFVKPQQAKGKIMLRIFSRLARFFGNYRYYRQMGAHAQEAWYLAKMTLPEEPEQPGKRNGLNQAKQRRKNEPGDRKK